MISDACFEVAEALAARGARPSAVERALNAFADELSAAERLGGGPAEVFAELRAGISAVKRAALPPADFAAMAKQVQRHLDSPAAGDARELLRRLREANAAAAGPPGKLRA